MEQHQDGKDTIQPDKTFFAISLNRRYVMSRQNLAAIAGTANEYMIRNLNEFKCEHLIDIKDGIITILNEKRLINMVN